VLWFPPALRRAYAPHDPCAEVSRLAMLEITGGCAPVDEIAAIATSATVATTVTHPNGTTTTTTASVPEAAAEPTIGFEAALAEVERYADNGDLHLLRRVAAAGWTLRAGLGQTTGRAFVVMARRRGPRALVWLGPAAGGRELLKGAPSRWRRSLWSRVRSLILGEAIK
jgi:hypothetical protein